MELAFRETVTVMIFCVVLVSVTRYIHLSPTWVGLYPPNGKPASVVGNDPASAGNVSDPASVGCASSDTPVGCREPHATASAPSRNARLGSLAYIPNLLCAGRGLA